ncbi:adenylate cyclase type 2-like [Sycon ciliatum]|uniref:adenylate cyclase type 2-like n=1 Tax=Sycon ciliatum TaxID=27933 RepID=UPI0031F70368
MGLDVCVAIDSVRKPNTSSSDVDMRVGVHTGNALSGILGQTKWQYDVWSTDVTLANHMESGGIPGKVHMSQQCLDSMLKNSTRQQLDEEFIIEEGHGQDRDAYLKKEEIQTYIIQSKKPRNIGLEVVGSDGEGEPDDASVTTDGPYESVSQHTNGSPKPKRKNGRLRRSRGLQPRGVDTEVVNAAIGEQIEKEQFLVQNGDRSIKMNFFLSIWSTLRSTDCGWLANTYYNGKIEMKYRKREDLYYWNHYPYVMVSAVGLLVVQAIMLPKTWIQLIFLLLLTFLSSFATLVFYAAWMKEKETLVETGPPTMTGETKKIPRSPFILRVRAVVIESVLARDLIALVLILPICACALISSALCDVNHVVEECNGTFIDFNRTQNADSFYCDYPSYYVFSCLLALSTSTIFPGMLFLVRAPVLFLVGTVMAVVLAIPLRDLFLVSDYRRQGFYSSVAILDDTAFESVFMLCLYVVIVIWQSKTMDMAHRLRYQKELDINKAIENLNQIESIKELVLENILPKTIADYYVKFKGDNEQDPDELYAEKHDDVCVMFASIPDYMGYYYEMEKENRTATDGGRESLRILNEIISDFDSVLSKPKFRTVEKIKTIGATYMAACGLSGQTLKCKTDGDDPPAVQGKFKQQKNLETMIEFAAAIQKVFGQIKINAFLEFDMRIGMNCGTVVAGVIGRSKPLYDIWGNTVNVASRMDSTGGQSEIQVTEEVAQVAKAAGYDVSLRGTVFVKGKGDLKTYYILTGLSLRLQAQEKAAAKAKKDKAEKDQASKAEPSLSPALAAAAAAPAAAAPPARAAGAGPTKSLAASNTAVTQVEESTADSRAAEAPELAPSKVKIL